MAAGKRFEKIVGKIRERADVGAAVAAMALDKLLGFKVAAERGLDFLSAQPLFDITHGPAAASVVTCRAGRIRRGCGVFAIDLARRASASSASCC